MTIISLIFLLLSNAVTLRREKSIQYSKKTITTLFCCCLIALKSLNMSFIDESLGLFGGLFHTTSVTLVFHIFIFIITAVIIHLTAFYPKKLWLDKYSSLRTLIFSNLSSNIDILNKMGQQFRILEYPLIILFIVIGGNLLVSASDIVSIFLSIELQSYGLYILCTLYRNSESSTSAGLIYFLLGGLSSCFILLGTSLLYANSASTNLDEFYVITGLSNVINENTGNTLDLYTPYYLNISLLIMSVGFLFKISAAPFHFWSPDVYDAIPTIVTTFVAIIAKISILIFFLELVHYTSNFYYVSSFSWTSGLLFSSLMSFVIGTILGLTQSRIKKLFAYSTISHLGFILLALSVNSLESIQAFMFYLMQYSISNLNAFMLLIAFGYFLYTYECKDSLKDQYDKLSDKNNSPIQLISQLKGYFYINTMLTLSFAITLFSFVGIPPLLGFFAKQMVLSAALDNGYVFLTLVAILTSVISAVYYLAVIKQMFFDNPEYKINENIAYTKLNGLLTSYRSNKKIHIDFKITNLTLSSSLSTIISILTQAILLFIFAPGDILSITNMLTLTTFNP